MKKLQDSVSEISIHKANFKWQDPGLIDLIRARKRAQGGPPCMTNGSGAFNCSPSGSAAIDECTGGGGGD